MHLTCINESMTGLRLWAFGFAVSSASASNIFKSRLKFWGPGFEAHRVYLLEMKLNLLSNS